LEVRSATGVDHDGGGAGEVNNLNNLASQIMAKGQSMKGKSDLGKRECDGGRAAATSSYFSVISAARMWYQVHPVTYVRYI